MSISKKISRFFLFKKILFKIWTGKIIVEKNTKQFTKFIE